MMTDSMSGLVAGRRAQLLRHLDVDDDRFLARLLAVQRDHLGRRLHDLAAVDADLARQLQRVQIGEVDLRADVGREVALHLEALQVRDQRGRNAGQQLRARHARHRERERDLRDHVQLASVRELEGARRQRQAARQPRRDVADPPFQAFQLQPPRDRVGGARQRQPDRDVLDRVGRQRIVMQRQPDHRQLAAEADRVADPRQVQRRVQRRVLGRQHRRRQHVADAPQRELLGAQRQLARPLVEIGAPLRRPQRLLRAAVAAAQIDDEAVGRARHARGRRRDHAGDAGQRQRRQRRGAPRRHAQRRNPRRAAGPRAASARRSRRRRSSAPRPRRPAPARRARRAGAPPASCPAAARRRTTRPSTTGASSRRAPPARRR